MEERPGHNSAMRAMSVAAFLCAVGFGIVTLLYPAVEETGAYITFGYLLAAFAPKAPQKFAEETIVAQVSPRGIPRRILPGEPLAAWPSPRAGPGADDAFDCLQRLIASNDDV